MRSKITQKAKVLMDRLGLSFEQLLALRFSVNVAIATWILWTTLRYFKDTNPIWAIASMIAAADPQPTEAIKFFKARLTNVLVGCAIGLFFLLIGETQQWMLPIALAVAVLVSSLIVRVKIMWRQAPITAAVVITTSLTSGTTRIGLENGLHKVGEVILGCIVGLVISLIMAKVWLIQKSDETT